MPYISAATPLNVAHPGVAPLGFGVFLAVLACMCVPVAFGVQVFRRREAAGSLLDAVREAFRPNADWGPKDATLRGEYHKFLLEAKDEEETDSRTFLQWLKGLRGGTQRRASRGVDNPLPPVASAADFSSFHKSDSRANFANEM